MKIIYTFIILALILPQPLKAQMLDSIIPVTCTHSNLPNNVSFILNAADRNIMLHLPVRYVSSIQIIDANNPWPPRWFATNLPCTGIKIDRVMLLPYNVSFQQGEIIFFNVINAESENAKPAPNFGYILCNRKLEPIDTFYRNNNWIDGHDFKLSSTGEKIYFETEDTIINGREIFGTDTLISLEYQNIQISDSRDSLIYCWNPLMQLGIQSFYRPYKNLEKGILTGYNFDWSHGNSLYFDYDGNILYSFKHIGIGKISRKDGHIIWRIDRNNLKPNDLSDTIPVYLQHDFKSVKNKKGNVIYTLVSCGDIAHPQCEAVQFTVKESDSGIFVIKLLKKIAAPKYITQTSGGNYELEKNGRYLLNYGIYKNYGIFQGHSTADHILFEYRDKSDQLLAQFTVLSRALVYRVQKLSNWAPPRPVIIKKNDILLSSSQELGGTWYKLEGKDLKVVKKVGSGSKFKPLESGYYCLAVKYGLGYSVSNVVNYTK